MMSVIGKGDEEGLRHVEKDVLIPKKMKAKAMKLCHDTVKGKKNNFTKFAEIINYLDYAHAEIVHICRV